jgi:hypothetical protein
MSGEKIGFAKEAAKMIIENLMEGDKISLVTYSDKTEVVFENGSHHLKQQLMAQVADIEADGNLLIAE